MPKTRKIGWSMVQRPQHVYSVPFWVKRNAVELYDHRTGGWRQCNSWCNMKCYLHTSGCGLVLSSSSASMKRV